MRRSRKIDNLPLALRRLVLNSAAMSVTAVDTNLNVPSLVDPQVAPAPLLPLVKRLFGSMVNEERDLVFVDLALCQSLVLFPMAALLYWRFHIAMGLVYLALLGLYWLGPYVLMLHNTSHRRLFKRKYDALNYYIPCVLGPLFGESPMSYFAHHVGMHHPENNLKDDLSSTMRFQRDSVWGFTRYFSRFFFAAWLELPLYFAKKGRRRLLLQCLLGELSLWALIGVAFHFNPQATTFVLILPYVICRFGMMAGNWAQHAFIDASAPENCYRNSLTCINSTYNRRCFNDGYHIGHHVRATRHWTEMPGDFWSQRERYAQENAIVFEGLDFFMVWLFLMMKRYDWLAKRMIDLGETRTVEQRIALLRERTRVCPI
jgi:Fatty acid desaturase